MLTAEELQLAREKLCAAQLLIAEVRDTFKAGGDRGGTRMLSEIYLCISDEVASIDKKLEDGANLRQN